MWDSLLQGTRMNAWLAIFIGGGVGSVLRFAVSRVLLLVQTKPLPVGHAHE